MDFIAVQKFVKLSPKKLRLVADVAKKMTPIEAIEKLSFLRKRGTVPMLKVIKTAIANAKEKEVSDDKLRFKEIQVSDGPRLKRGRPVSRGRWHPIVKRMSHIRVVLTTTDKKVEKPAANDMKSKDSKIINSKIKIQKPKIQFKYKKGVKPVKAKK